MQVLSGVLGIAFFLGVAVLISRDRKAINWRLVGVGLTLQLVLANVVLNQTVQEHVFGPINDLVKTLLGFSEQGATFVLSSFVTGSVEPAVLNFAFWVLPTVVYFSAIMSLLYYLGLMQPVIKVIAKVMQKTMGTSGSESMSCSANIFVGQTEAPLLVKPFIEKMTKSELHAVMVGGFGTVAGGVLALYVATLKDFLPDIAGHLVTASCMAAPGALVVSKIIYPEKEESVTMGDVKMEVEIPDSNAIEAVSRGASEGMQLLINIVAMLIAFVAIVFMFDAFLSWVTGFFIAKPLTFTALLGYIFSPFAFFMGIRGDEIMVVGELLGKKLVLTELIAYKDMASLIAADKLSARAATICAYALCGFANFASIGIQIGGIGGIAPDRRGEIASMGLTAMLGGMLVTCITGTIAGAFLH